MKPYSFHDVKAWARTLPSHREPRTNRTVYNELVKAERSETFTPGIRGVSGPDVLKRSFSFAHTEPGSDYWRAVIDTMNRQTDQYIPMAC